jgi:hypothetical protein
MGVGWQVTAGAYGPHAPEIQTRISVVHTGQPIDVFGEHFKPGATITLKVDDVVVGTTTAGTDGSFATSITIPSGLHAGAVHIVATDSLPELASTDVRVEKSLAISFTSPDGTTATIGQHFSFRVTATGSPRPRFSESGALPTGVAFGSHGLLSGDPASGSASVYKITITATNFAGSATQGFSLRVS